MRTIKFRAWHTQKKVMFSPETMGADQLTLMPDGQGFINVSSTSTRLSVFIREMVPMQYIGLADKNGREIFEGDILKADSQEESALYAEVVYRAPHYRLRYGPEPTFGGYWAIDNPESWIVVGNIYENPELMGGAHGQQA